eukprot:s252_g7.t1
MVSQQCCGHQSDKVNGAVRSRRGGVKPSLAAWSQSLAAGAEEALALKESCTSLAAHSEATRRITACPTPPVETRFDMAAATKAFAPRDDADAMGVSSSIQPSWPSWQWPKVFDTSPCLTPGMLRILRGVMAVIFVVHCTWHVVEYAFLRGEGFYYFLFLTNWSVAILYWTLLRPIWDVLAGEEEWPAYLPFFVHGIDTILMLITFFACRVPYTCSHAGWVAIFAVLYGVLTYLHHVLRIGRWNGCVTYDARLALA